MAFNEIKTIILLGAGKVATQLALAFTGKGLVIKQVWSRSHLSAKKLAGIVRTHYTGNIRAIRQDGDIYMVCVPDQAIGEVAAAVPLHHNQLLVHTSGSVPIEVLKNYSQNTGVFYPLQTFSPGREIAFDRVPLLVEANDLQNRQLLLSLAGKISGHVIVMDSEKRKYAHLAAVFASNFSNFMYTIAGEILAMKGLSFDLLKPLIEETAAKVQSREPYVVQTGPAMRHDEAVIREHLRLLSENDDFAGIYQLINEMISRYNFENHNR
jgi:predicted short-subunit dehydrogenase-like oxidoreductase (DUF2520 family)